jgi:hypothetical protein
MIAQVLTYCTNICGLHFISRFWELAVLSFVGYPSSLSRQLLRYFFLDNWRMVGIEIKILGHHEVACMRVIEIGKFLSTEQQLTDLLFKRSLVRFQPLLVFAQMQHIKKRVNTMRQSV